jgi:hypothetical protein
MSDLPEISLPHGTTYVTVEQGARLIADALHPRGERRISRLNKVTDGRERGLTEDDERLIRSVEPPYRPGMTEREFRAFEAALQAAGAPWNLRAYFADGPEAWDLAFANHETKLLEGLRKRTLRRYALVPEPVGPSTKIILADFERHLLSIPLRLSIDFVCIADILEPSASHILKAAPERWQRPGHNNDVRGQVALRLTELHLQHFVKGMVDSGSITTINGAPLPDELLCDAPWGFTRVGAEEVRKSLPAELPDEVWAWINAGADESEGRRAQRQVYADSRRTESETSAHARRAAGRYIISEACVELGEATPIEAARWEERMLADIKAGKLPVCNPRNLLDTLPYTVPRIIRPYYDQVNTAGLNAWLDAHPKWSVSYRFNRAASNEMGQSERANRTTILEIAERIAKEAADRRPEKWKHPTDPDPMRRTIVAAMNTHGWPDDGIPGVLPLIFKELESGRIAVFSTFNDLPFSDISEVRTNPAKWYVTREGEAALLKAVTGQTAALSAVTTQATNVSEYVVPNGPEPQSSQPAQESKTSGESDWQGRSIVTPIIEEAIAAVSPVSLQTVFPKLRELALAKKGPFTGKTALDGGLLYLDAKNEQNKYSREALRAYLRRRKTGRKRA